MVDQGLGVGAVPQIFGEGDGFFHGVGDVLGVTLVHAFLEVDKTFAFHGRNSNDIGYRIYI